MRSIPDDFDAAVVAAIDERLANVEIEHRVRIPWAIESGSRAWGFASPDSDYDCRFFYVRAPSAYVDPWPERDVIETPLQGLLDVNGWDLRKAVQLAVAGNATVGEWLRSPWVYCGDDEFDKELLALVGAVMDPVRLRRHYLHVGRAQWVKATEEPGVVRLKRVFYAIRPAVTLHWLDSHAGVPPMNLDDLLNEAPVPDDVAREIAGLRDLKARTRELGTAAARQAIAEWTDAIFSRQDDRYTEPLADVRDTARQGFLAMLQRWAPEEF